MSLDPSLTEFTTASPVLTNYDYTDVINGFGYIEFYPMITDDSTADYLLSTKPKCFAQQIIFKSL